MAWLRHPSLLASLCFALLTVLAMPAVAGAAERGLPSSPQGDGSAQPRIVGGQTTTTGAYPWQAAIVLDETFNLDGFEGQFCGASLIAPRIVITAAHCVYDTDPDCFNSPPGPGPCLPGDFEDGDGTTRLDPNDANVVLGRTTLSTTDGEEHDVQAVHISESYNPATLESDVAFLVLETPSAQVPIKLAGRDEAHLWGAGALTETSGWGATSEGGPSSDTLRVVTVPIVDDAVCGDPGVYGTDFKPATMVCAGYLEGGKDACQGDSGGPLHAPGAGYYRLVGVTSWGTGCARENLPGVYARVGGGSSVHDAVVAQVLGIEAEHGLAQTEIVGSAPAEPPPAEPPPVSTDPPPDYSQLACAEAITKVKAARRAFRRARARRAKARRVFRATRKPWAKRRLRRANRRVFRAKRRLRVAVAARDRVCG